MALTHPQPGDVIDVGPLGDRLAATRTQALLKTQTLELMRVVLRSGEALPPHAVDAEVVLHCLEGSVVVDAGAEAEAGSGTGERRLDAGTLVVLPAGMRHRVRAVADASLLMTMLLPYRGSASATSPG